MGAINIKAIDHVVLRVAEFDRAIAFYCGALGCTVERRRDDLGLIHLRAGNAQIDLITLDGKLGREGGAGPATEGRNVDHICLRIDAFDETAIRTHLEAHGITSGDVAPRFGADGTGPSMYIADPDGNSVELKGPPHDR